ncbi:hypothetical protein Sliba_52640 [Streptomyces nigrescens]|uniref:Uncharacterized protein n=1 Tax=Streptomyces nigrescens TaxID=1920 RepID=A0A640TRC4_STRNI|nr:hypothetical protein Sliba_52640 [Streptomyces libani subsp. libani]GGV95375.1 hypothetical protein GCM10010500_35570 [Streptomyces libani subsp. libani]
MRSGVNVSGGMGRVGLSGKRVVAGREGVGDGGTYGRYLAVPRNRSGGPVAARRPGGGPVVRWRRGPVATLPRGRFGWWTPPEVTRVGDGAAPQ